MWYVVTKLDIVYYTMWEVVYCYEIGNRILYDVESRMLLRSWKSYVVRCGKSYVVAKLEIVCCAMWEVVCCYKVGNRMLHDVGSHMMLLYWKSYFA